MPSCGDAASLYAFRRWRDESVLAMQEAEWLPLSEPECPVVVIAAKADRDVRWEESYALAMRLRAECWTVPGDHLSPLLSQQAVCLAERALAWARSVCVPTDLL